MGSGSSQPKPTVDEKLVERLQAVTMVTKNEHGNDFVYLEGEKDSHDGEPRAQDISISAFAEWEKKLLQDPKNQLALSALSNNDPMTVLSSRAAKIADTQIFNVKIPLEGSPVTQQNKSGRCWLFAVLNVFRVAMMRKYNLKEFQFSQSWLFYWDKIEKANYFLESIIETADDEALDGRLVQHLLASPVGDGGQWDMAVNLIQKYGLVPLSLYPDSYNASNSSMMDSLLTSKLREYALTLRRLVHTNSSPTSLLKAKTTMLEEIHLIITLLLGPPPSPSRDFTWEYYDKDGSFHALTTSPRDFAASLSTPAPGAVGENASSNVGGMFSLVNDPRNAYNTLLTVSRLGNVKEGQATTYVNVSMKTLKNAVIAMLKAGLPVMFGSDVGKYMDRTLGILDTGLFNYEVAFNTKLGMSKEERLRAGESQMTHAMVLTGVHLDTTKGKEGKGEEGRPVRWRVENSWGEKSGSEGYFVMSDAWMEEFCYQAVVDPKFVSKEVRDVLKQDPIVLPLWDPMGSLA